MFTSFLGPPAGNKHINWAIGADPIHLTTSRPFQSSQTSFEVDDMRSTSATARFSLALPMMALSHGGPPTLMALTIAVMMPKGAIANMILSAQPIDWLMNCMVTRSPKRASSLVTVDRQHTTSNKIDDKTFGARSENKLLEKSSPESAVTQPTNNIAKRKFRFLVTAILPVEDGGSRVGRSNLDVLPGSIFPLID